MKQPVFSILIPCFNSEKYLDECLLSVKNQNFDDYEVIAVDDGSTDSTLSILKKWKISFKNMRVFAAKHAGVSAARNLLVKKAKGIYCIFLDSDDIMCENLLKNLNDCLSFNIDCFVGKFKSFSDDDKTHLPYGEEIDENKINFQSPQDVFTHFRDVKIINALCRFVVRTSIIKNNKFMFHKGIVHEDEEWTTKVLTCCNSFYCLNQPHFLYRRHENSITAKMTDFNIMSKIVVAEELMKFSKNFDGYKKDFILRKVYRICKEVYYTLREKVGDENG